MKVSVLGLLLAAFSLSSTGAQSVIPIYWGATIRGAHYGLPEPATDMQAVEKFEANAGKKVSIIHIGKAWFSGGVGNNFPVAEMDNIRAHTDVFLAKPR